MIKVKTKEIKELLAYNCILPSTTGYHSLPESQNNSYYVLELISYILTISACIYIYIYTYIHTFVKKISETYVKP
jgi:hypothetical protein